MAIYTYKARDAFGKSVKGAMEAVNKAEIIDKLHKIGYMPTKVNEMAKGLRVDSIIDKLKRINSTDMLIFYIQLANMIDAGIPILMSLSTLAKQIENKKLRTAISNVSRQVEAGSVLSQAFATEPRIFSRLFVNMIKAGEASGHLNTVLIRYADFFEQQEDLKQKVKGALFYPVILLCAGLAVTLFIVTFIIPQFAEIYLRAGIKLPVPTLIVYKLGMAIKHYWSILILLAAASLVGIRYYFSSREGAFILDSLKLKAPVLGLLYRKVIIARLTRTLSTLLGSGVPILESLDITKDVAGNEIFGRAIVNIRRSVEKGERMAEPMKMSEEFPSDVVQMTSVGEETGNLEGMLNKVADFYDMSVTYVVKKLTAVIEPLFLVIIGIMVGTIMASMLMPIFDMVRTLRH